MYLENENYDYTFKYILVGDYAVGKSNILLRFSNNEFNTNYFSTIGVEFSIKKLKVNNKNIRIQVWDTAGQERFLGITKTYFKNCACIIVVYDITRKLTFDNLNIWINEIKNICSKSVYIILLGNKCDLENQREVSYKEGEKYAEENNFKFYETSAKDNINIIEVFEESSKIICDNIEKNYYDMNDPNIGIKNRKEVENKVIQKDNNDKKNKCC